MKTLFYGPDRPRFPFWEIVFVCFLSLLKPCKISPFCTKVKEIWLKSFENNCNIFPKFFFQKMSDFGEILVSF